MLAPCAPSLDPRIRRTRHLLQSSLGNLLETRPFEDLSVQDITDAATVNRATFYDHYPDKFALLECMVATRFHELLRGRGVKFEGPCPRALRAMVLGVCEFLAALPGAACERQRQLEPHLESAVIAVVRGMILEGLKRHPPGEGASPEMISAAASWAVYGAAQEWVRTPERCPAEEVADTVMLLVGPMLG